MDRENPENDELIPDGPELTEFEQAVADQFEPAQEPEAPADGSPDPDPASDEVEPPEGAEETGEEEPTPAEPEPPAATDDYIEVGGQLFPRAEVENLIGWASQLGPEDFIKIRDALSGAPEAPTSEPEPETPGLDLDEVLDPKLAEYVQSQFGALQSEIEQLRQREIERIQAENVQQQQMLVDAFTEARTGIVDRLGLSESDAEALINKTEQSGIVAYLSQQGGLSNPKAMFEQALETTFYMDSEFRERVIQKTAEERAAEQADLAAKKARAGAVAGKGSNASRTPDAPTTKEERWADMVNTIARELQDR